MTAATPRRVPDPGDGEKGTGRPKPLPHLFFLARIGSRPVGGLLEENFLHFPILEVVQLPDGVLGPLDQVQHHPLGTLPQQEPVLGEMVGGGRTRTDTRTQRGTLGGSPKLGTTRAPPPLRDLRGPPPPLKFYLEKNVGGGTVRGDLLETRIHKIPEIFRPGRFRTG